MLLVSFGGPRGPRRRDPVPGERDARARGIPPRAAGRGRPSTTCCSAASARSTPRTPRCSTRCARTSPTTASTCRSTGATATGTPYLADAVAQMARRRGTPGAGVRDRRRTPRTPAAGSTGRTSPTPRWPSPGRARRSTSCGPTSTTPASWSRSSTPPSRRSTTLPDDARDGARLVFTTHSIPVAQADRSGALDRPGGAYVAQHRAVAGAGRRRGSRRARPASCTRWDLVYQSRSGPPTPAVARAGRRRPPRASWPRDGVPGVVVVPIGFVSDHMEVVYDLDTAGARRPPTRLGLPIARAATPGTDPRFVAMVVDLVRERLDGRPAAERAALSDARARGGTSAWPAAARTRAAPRPAAGRAGLTRAAPTPDLADAGRARRSDVAAEAGRMLLRRAAAPRSRSAPSPRPTDVVTEMDTQVRAAARRPASAAPAPTTAFLGEEGAAGDGQQRRALGDRPARRHRQLPLRPAAVGGEHRASRSTAVVRGGRGRGAGAGGRRSPRSAAAGATRNGEPDHGVRPAAGWTRRWSAPGSATTRAGGRTRRRCVAQVLPVVRDIRRLGAAASVDLC